MTDVITHEFGAVDPDALRKYRWVAMQDQPNQDNQTIDIQVNTEHQFQTVSGLGGSFSELGWQALLTLTPEQRDAAVRALFDVETGAGFTMCRLPIGASDFALDAYSPDDHDGDYAMEQFSLARDEQYLIPFIQAALTASPALQIHASPWSPPGWLKTSKNMISGSLVDTAETYRAYALYMQKFVEGYGAHGIAIDNLVIQNESDATPHQTLRQEDHPGNFPGCWMPPEQMVKYAVDYLAPTLRDAGLDTRIWGGTYRTMTGLWSHRCMADPRFRAVVEGAGFQYSFPGPIQDLQTLYPEKKVMHTESVCYDGRNLADQSMALFYDFMDYMEAGCVAYTYWNMVLNETGLSSWGWRQNSLITVNRETGEAVLNPDHAVMSLLSRNIRPGARRIESFCFVKRTIAFRNTDGSVVAFVWNNGAASQAAITIDGERSTIELPAYSLSVIRR